MKSSKSRLSLVTLAAGFALLSACVAPGAPVTPETLAGCWEGSAFANAASAKVDIKSTDEPDRFVVDGNVEGFGQSLPLSNIRVSFEDGELKPESTAQAALVKLEVKGDVITVSSPQAPLTMDLRRCNG